MNSQTSDLIAIALLFIGMPLSIGLAIGFVIWVFMKWDTK